MSDFFNKFICHFKNGLHYTYETYNSYFSIDKIISNNNLNKNNKCNEKINLNKQLNIEEPRWFCVWDNNDDKYRFIHIDELTTMNYEFKETFLNNKNLKKKYNPFLGIKEFDTIHKENYYELKNLFNNGLDIKIDKLDENINIHPVIQCALSNNLDISPRLKNYYNNKINCFYLQGIVDDNYIKELYYCNLNKDTYVIDDYYKLFEDNDIILN